MFGIELEAIKGGVDLNVECRFGQASGNPLHGETDAYSTDVHGPETKLCGPAFLGQGLFCIDGRPGRAGNTRGHTAPGERGSSGRSNATDVVDPYRGLKEP